MGAYYTVDEIEIIRQHYPSKGAIPVARMLERSVEAIRAKANDLGVSCGLSVPKRYNGRNSPDAWTDDEILALRQAYADGGRLTAKERIPGRSLIAIIHKAKSLGLRADRRKRALKKDEQVAYRTAEQIANQFRHTIVPAGQWTIDHPTAARSVFDLAGAV